jgi:hypothetical protein
MNSVRKIHGNGQLGSGENKLEEHLPLNDVILIIFKGSC